MRQNKYRHFLCKKEEKINFGKYEFEKQRIKCRKENCQHFAQNEDIHTTAESFEYHTFMSRCIQFHE